MARIDVSELMVDPDFINSFSIARRTATTNIYGENIIAETIINNITGSVQSAGKEAIKRLPEGVKISNVKTIYTKTMLIADTNNPGYSDQIIWEGLRYNVISCLPWSNFGAGWYEVDVEMQRATK